MSKIKTDATVTTEPTMADVLKLMMAQNDRIDRLTKVVTSIVEREEPDEEPEAEESEIDMAELGRLKAWAKANGIETRGSWTAERIAKVKAQRDAAKSVKVSAPKVQAPTSGGRFGRVVTERSERSGSRRPTRAEAPGMLANHPYRATMLTLSADDWLDLASHGAGEKRDKDTGRIIRKGQANPTGMTANWRFIAKTMSGTATVDGEPREITPNIQFEACNIAQHLVESGKL